MGARRRLTLLLPLLPLVGLAEDAARFHHIHLNSTDPAAAIRFYTKRLASEASRFAGKPALWTQASWLLFEKVRIAPPLDTDSPIWHIGWGAPDMKAAYQKLLDLGTPFHTPLTDISDLANFPGFFYAYIDGPDHALIEINTARHSNFGHLHLFSADPIAAAEWYGRLLGIQPRLPRSREPRIYRGFTVGPSASFTIGNVNVILFPAAYRGHNRFSSSRGTVFDHVAFSFGDATAAAARVEGARILQPLRPIKGARQRSMFLEGPDRAVLELVEGHATRP